MVVKMALEKNKIYCGDCLDLMKEMEDRHRYDVAVKR